MSIKFSILSFLIYCIGITVSDTVLDRINKEGYPAQRHSVKTKDGYILGLYRIPNRKAGQNNHKVILMMHGLFVSSPAFLARGRHKSAGYFFSDVGYDVWMSNARGNMHSRNHTTLNPDETEFWDFSWHEIALYDLPATIDYILKRTNKTKLDYIGHSQGVTVAIAMLCLLPEYNKKINTLHAMAPPIIMKHVHPALAVFLQSTDLVFVESSAKLLGATELLPHKNPDLYKFVAYLCVLPAISEICKWAQFITMGTSDQYHKEYLIDSVDHAPAGCGYKQLLHFGQIAKSGEFKKFDHGPEKNKKLYGRETPPDYNLKNVKTRIHLIYGVNDNGILPENIPLIAAKLGRNIIAISKFEGFNHVDFTYAEHLEVVQQKILAVLMRLG